MLPFSPPRADQKIVDAVSEVLLSGWISTGPKTKQFEKELSAYCGSKSALCLNSATAGLELMLRWFGVQEGDEVIVPAYTYCATANVVLHCGAKPVMVDVGQDFNINVEAIRKAITPRTKAVIPVDFAGYPCNYDDINALVATDMARKLFQPSTQEQRMLGRILVLSDSAHSIGARYKGKMTGSLTDVSVFSFHAVKNLTTAEGGCIAFNLPEPFDNDQIYQTINVKSLHGQNKDALAKVQKGGWKYDIVEPGYKCNMTDIQAAIGRVELARYEAETLPKRKHIFDYYTDRLKQYSWAELPPVTSEDRTSCYHVFALRIRGINETQRDAIIQGIFNRDVAVNVHFQPLPLLTTYKSRNYQMEDYPIAYQNYSREISLPVYYNLTDDNLDTVLTALVSSVNEILGK